MTDAKEMENRHMVEAALFVAGHALGLDEISKATGIMSPGYLKKVLAEIASDYDNNGNTVIKLFEIGGKYLLGLKEPYASKVNGLAGSPDLTKSALRILAYTSKNEPIMQNAIVKAFGSSSYEHIKELIEKDFITASKVGRTKRLQTTQKFKEYFNLNG